MQRSRSFSRNGIQLDVNLHSAMKPKNRQALQKVFNSKSSTILKATKPKPLHPTQSTGIISKLTSRSIPSSFQKCHTPVQNVNVIYNEKIELTKRRNHFFSMKKFSQPSYFETVSCLYKKEHDQQEREACGKLTRTMTSERWAKSSSRVDGVDGQKSGFSRMASSSSKLLIPFEKQTERPFYEKLRKLEEESFMKPLPTSQVDEKRASTQHLSNLRKTHNFQSYSKHDLLNPQKISQFSSEMNVHLVDLKRFKQRNQSSHMKFDKFIDQVKTRYDRDCTPWLVKLSYDCKDDITRGNRQVRRFEKQCDRKINEVHSKYPMRLTM